MNDVKTSFPVMKNYLCILFCEHSLHFLRLSSMLDGRIFIGLSEFCIDYKYELKRPLSILFLTSDVSCYFVKLKNCEILFLMESKLSICPSICFVTFKFLEFIPTFFLVAVQLLYHFLE